MEIQRAGFAERQSAHLSQARRALEALAGNAELNVGAALDRVYRTFAELELAARSGALSDLASLASDAQAVVDRIRLHRLPLSPVVLELLRQTVSCLAGPGDPSAVAAARQAIAGIVVASQPPESDRTDLELFIEEARQQLETCRRSLASLRGDLELDASPVNAAFRALHTFKGNCGLMGLVHLESLARVAEDALGGMRSGELAPTKELRSALQALLTTTERSLDEPSERGEDARQSLLLAAQQARLRAQETRLGDLLVARKLVDPVQVQAALAWQQRPLGEVLVELEALSSEALEDALQEQRRLRGATGLVAPSTLPTDLGSASSITQVHADRLVRLVELATELAASAQAVAEAVPGQAGVVRLKELSASVREAAARVRLLPVARAFKRVQLVVNDLARKQGKLVELVCSGLDLEVERGMLEHLSTILLHLAKNAVDHGIELPAERARAGKDPQGHLRVAFTLAPRDLEIIVSDDGRGLDRQRILERAQELGMSASEVTDARLVELIFEPGFSTLRAATDASGRGVGMDAVRSTVWQLGGRLQLAFRPGQGTSVTLTLPRPQGAVGASDGAASSGTWPLEQRERQVR